MMSYAKLIKLATKYYRLIDKKYLGQYNDLGIEFIKRIYQVSRLLTKIKYRNRIVTNFPEIYIKKYAPNLAPKKVLKREQKLFTDLEDLTECYYYFASRLIDVTNLLPLLHIKVKGIKVVRNQLIEHPEGKSSSILIPSFSAGADIGPVIKGPRYSHQVDTQKDSGLYPNTKELILKLESSVQNAINMISKKKNA